jgi:HAD superfamily hydrolase (TIGR01509 family)
MNQAVIFDMDGVLTDSEPLICAAAMEMFRRRGRTVREEDFLPFVGAGENRYIGGVAEQYGMTLDIAEAKAETYALYLEMVPTRLNAFPGAVAFVNACRSAGRRCAVASSADRIKIDANLHKIGLPPETWDAVVSAEDAERRKPHPDIFLKAAQRLGMTPDVCTVIEDAVNGVAAAKAAGMRCIAVASSFPPAALAQADLVRATIADLRIGDLSGPVAG